MNGMLETTCAAALLGFALMFTFVPAHGEEMSYPEKCKAHTMAMPAHGAEAGKAPEMSSEMTDYQKSFMMGMGDMNKNMMSGMLQDDADVAFICGMIAHHMGAVSMAQTELTHGDNAAARDMAQKIIDAQLPEIEQMKAWLEKGEK